MLAILLKVFAWKIVMEQEDRSLQGAVLTKRHNVDSNIFLALSFRYTDSIRTAIFVCIQPSAYANKMEISYLESGERINFLLKVIE